MTAEAQDKDERNILLQAWIEARNEVDKSIFLSASAGVGFCVSQLFGDNVASNIAMTVCLCIACVSFMLSSVVAVLIFQGNAKHYAKLLGDPDADTKDKWLDRLDKAMVGFFILAVLALGAAVITHLTEKKVMVDKTLTKPAPGQVEERSASGIPLQRPTTTQPSAPAQQPSSTGTGSSQNNGSSERR